MPIDITCPNCSKDYKVKDVAAGKKVRCKECETLIPVPEAVAAEDADPWESLPDPSEWGDTVEPPPRTARKPKTKSGRPGSGASGGMPWSIIFVLCINGLFIATNVLVAILNVLGGSFRGAGGSAVRVMIEVSIIKGLLARSAKTRKTVITLDILGIILATLALVIFVAFSDKLQQQAGGAPVAIVFAAMAFLYLIGYVAELVAILMPSARDFCDQN